MNRVVQLDGIRGLAVAIVVIVHFTNLLRVGLDNNLPLLIIFRFLQSGWLGVDIFFVLSGFLITGIILKERSKPNFWGDFYLRRSVRILPAFAVIFTITLLIAHFLLRSNGIRTSSVLMSMFFLANWTILRGLELPMLDHLWSLAVEEQFYFLWPQAAKRLSTETVLKLSLVLAVTCEFLRIGAALAHVNAIVVYKITPTAIDGLSIGAALAASMAIPKIKRFLARRWSTIAAVAAWTCAAAFVMFRGTFFVYNLWSQVVATPVVAILFAMLIYASVEGLLPPVLAAFFGHPIMTWLGRRSYGLYLIHVPIYHLVADIRRSGSFEHLPVGLTINILLAFCGIALALILAEASWRLVEAPAQNLRRRLLSNRSNRASSQIR